MDPLIQNAARVWGITGVARVTHEHAEHHGGGDLRWLGYRPRTWILLPPSPGLGSRRARIQPSMLRSNRPCLDPAPDATHEKGLEILERMNRWGRLRVPRSKGGELEVRDVGGGARRPPTVGNPRAGRSRHAGVEMGGAGAGRGCGPASGQVRPRGGIGGAA